jgi:crotonobetainyl-CoA:carnitine CoA-transferase CaiB-like acyl-CoA transferase
MPERVLSDVKVLDLSRYIAGPYCTKLLADYGADVIKVERPGSGDPARTMGPFQGDDPDPEKSGLFLYLNTNKRSITLNLKTETGKKLFMELAKDADILVESFRPGVMERLGLGYQALEKVNPKLVMASISNFGQTGLYRDYKASHLIEGAIGGWMYVTGDPEREPLQGAGWLIHYAAGLTAAIGLLTALYYQQETGQGQYVDLSMMEAATHITTVITSYYTYQGLLRNRTGNVMLQGLGFVARCRDGYLGVNAYTVPQWEILFRWVGMHDILADPRLQTREGRTEHAREITERLKLYFRDKGTEESFYGAQEQRLPFAPVPTTKELLASPQLKAREYFVEAEHATTGRVAYPGAPFKMAETPWAVRRPAPLLGQHNQEIFGQRLGYSREELTRLRERGVI